MTQKAEFNADEWTTVVEGPLLAGARVITSDRGGTIRESLAMGKVYKQAREQQGGSELLDELMSSPPAMDPQRMQTASQGGKVSTDGIRQAVELLEQKATLEEVDAYKGFIKGVADAVARAHKEGGFLGIGGKEISPEEQTALDEVEAALS